MGLRQIIRGNKVYLQEWVSRNGRQVYVRSWKTKQEYTDAQTKDVVKATREYPHLEIRPRPSQRQRLGQYQIMPAGDFTEKTTEIKDGTIDVIITDPPYPKEYLPLYGKLGEVAKRVLKPGGSLLVMVGQSYLPEILSLLAEHLTYNWVVSYLTPGGQSAQLWQRKVNTFWKPVLWYVKEGYTGKWIGDVAKSAVNANEKNLHDWQQSESGMLDLVDRFTKRGDLILDPFMGSGSTGVAAIKLGRHFVGIDISDEAVATARTRLAEVSK